MTFQMGFYECRIHFGQIADGFDTQQFQFCSGSVADHEEIPDWKRPHFHRDFFGEKGVNFVRFFKIRSHLCQQAVGGDADIHSEAQSVTNCIFDYMGCPDRVTAISGDRDIFGKTFINTVLTDGRSIMMKQIKQLTAALAVVMMFRRYNGQIGTFSQGIGDRFSGADAVSGCSYGFGQDNAMPFGHITAYNSRNLPEICFTAVTEQFDGCPA